MEVCGKVVKLWLEPFCAPAMRNSSCTLNQIYFYINRLLKNRSFILRH